MSFNRNRPNNDDGTTFYSDVTTYSDTDLENGTIFVLMISHLMLLYSSYNC